MRGLNCAICGIFQEYLLLFDAILMKQIQQANAIRTSIADMAWDDLLGDEDERERDDEKDNALEFETNAGAGKLDADLEVYHPVTSSFLIT